MKAGIPPLLLVPAILAIVGCEGPRDGLPAQAAPELRPIVPVFQPDTGYFQELSWSPDGRRIAYSVLEIGPGGTYPYHIERIDADGTNRVELTRGPRDYWTSWSPDGSRIVYSGEDDGDMDLYAMDTDGSARTRITSGPEKDVQPDWSPRGTEIVFVRDGKLSLVDSEGGGPRPLGTQVGEAQNPEWSPDGERIAYFESFGAGQDTVYIVNRDGTRRRRLTAGVFPSWSPDDSLLLFGRDDGIHSIREDGTDERMLVPGKADYAEFSPNGSRIAYVIVEEGYVELRVMRADGSNARALLRRPAPSWSSR